MPAQVVGSEAMGCNGTAETATLTVLMAKDEEIIARVVKMRAGGDWAHSGMPRIAPYMPMQLLRRTRDLIECVHSECTFCLKKERARRTTPPPTWSVPSVATTMLAGRTAE